MKSIIYGICGIGNGHTYRQLPIIDHFSKGNKIVVFAYGNSLSFYSNHFKKSSNVHIVEVAVPYFVGSESGIDFAKSAELINKSKVNHTHINALAMEKARDFLGNVDLVISDYEPVSAQFAYTYNAPLVTIDQQTKYLYGDFPSKLNGCTYIDEVQRLRMFFPKAEARIVCSFFNVKQVVKDKGVHFFPPIFNDDLKAKPHSKDKEVLVYISTQESRVSNLSSVISVLSADKNIKFNVFSQSSDTNIKTPKNITLHKHDNNLFKSLLQSCNAVIATAGHSLLSEALYLGKPVLAIPLDLYEQQMNAEIINKGGFGLSTQNLTAAALREFLADLDIHTENIKSDKTLLLRGNGKMGIIDFIERSFLSEQEASR